MVLAPFGNRSCDYPPATPPAVRLRYIKAKQGLTYFFLKVMSVASALLRPHVRDLGGFPVRRVLPGFPHQTVGPFIFFDHFGPIAFPPGEGIDVRPHPHIGLATVTYLFAGAILHRDSLGSVQKIVPGDVNWMTAG